MCFSAALICAGCVVHETPPSTLSSEDITAVRELAKGARYLRYDLGSDTDEKGWALVSPALLTADMEDRSKECLDKSDTPVWRTVRLMSIEARPRAYYLFTAGPFRSESEAKDALDAAPQLQSCGFHVRHASMIPVGSTVPLRVHVLEIDPGKFQGQIISALANDVVSGSVPTSGIAERHGAIAAINGGFLVRWSEGGIAGEPAGLTVIAGAIVSEPNWGRPALVLTDNPQIDMRIAVPERPLSIEWPDGSSTVIDGVNRKPGLIANCGTPDDKPYATPRHDVLCTDESETIVLTSHVGPLPIDGLEIDRIFDAGGRLLPVGAAEIPDGGFAVAVTGDDEEVFLSKARRQLKATFLPEPLLSELGSPTEWPGLYAVNGGPTLLLDGMAIRREHAEGWTMSDASSPERVQAAHRWINLRHPRSAAGQRRDGTILLVTVEGRRPGISAGASIGELRDLMAGLGAVEAINLDGGGSATMFVDGALVTVPLDSEGERDVADAILVIPDEPTGPDLRKQ